MLRVKNLTFNYPKQSHFPGVRGVSFELDRGEVLAVLGASGSGKTTLLKCIYGLEDLFAGSVTIDGEPVAGPSQQLIPGHRDMKFVSQDYYVLDNHTVRENIYDKLTGMRDEDKERRAVRLMKLLEILPLADAKAKTLSSGQKQRVAIARSLADMPKVLLLDEPFNNLDKPLAEKLITFIVAEVRKKKSALILITHIAEEALRHADHVLVLDKGRVVQSGATADVYDRPRSQRLAELFGRCNIIRQQDLADTSRLNMERARLFVRPDRFIVAGSKENADLHLTVRSSQFNGRCYEVLGTTASGQNVTVYHSSPLKEGETAWLKISERDQR